MNEQEFWDYYKRSICYTAPEEVEFMIQEKYVPRYVGLGFTMSDDVLERMRKIAKGDLAKGVR